MYDVPGKRHSVEDEIVEGNRSFRDHKACDRCQMHFKMSCGEETFLIHTDVPIRHLYLEEFLNGFKNISKERCDALFHNDRKLLLMDMYCGMSDYLGPHLVDGKPQVGKKAKVRRQIESVIDLMYQVPEMAERIDAMEEKVGLFAFRAKDWEMVFNVPRKVESSVGSFLKGNRDLERRKLALPMAHGFRYLTNAYPKRYQW